MSIDFANPGTVDHVVTELQENLNRLYEMSANLTARFEADQAGYQAANGDTMARISIIEAGLERYHNSVQKSECCEPGGVRAGQTLR
jgi:hypothetical protein